MIQIDHYAVFVPLSLIKYRCGCTFLHQKFNSLSKESCLVVNKNAHQQYAFWCPERWKSHFRASRFQIFSGGGMPPDPTRRKGPYGPFSGHSHLLNLQWPLITKVIETPNDRSSWELGRVRVEVYQGQNTLDVLAARHNNERRRLFTSKVLRAFRLSSWFKP